MALSLLARYNARVVHYYWLAALLSLGPELVGAAVTYGLFELFIWRREREKANKEKLKKELGSTIHSVAIAAAEKLRDSSWLYDGSLQGAYLWEADLQGAKLWEANLRGAYLNSSKLQRAFLGSASLQRADLGGAKLDENTALPDATKWTP